MKKKSIVLLILTLFFSLNLFCAENPESEILSKGSWRSNSVKQTVKYDNGRSYTLDQEYEYRFFNTQRFTIWAFVKDPSETKDNSDVTHWLWNIRLYGTYTVEGKTITFNIEPEETFCAFKDTFATEEEYKLFMDSYLKQCILCVNEINKIDMNEMILTDKNKKKSIKLYHLSGVR